MTSQEKITLLRQKLAQLKSLHPKQSEWFTCGEKWSQAQVDAFEKEQQLFLPEEYKLYLMEMGNGGAGKAWHGDCDCGKISVLEEGALLEKMKKPFAFDGQGYDTEMGWMDASTYEALGENLDDYEDLYGLPDGAKYDDGCFRIGYTTNHEGLYLVINSKDHAGEVWVDYTGYDGDFKPSGKGFLDFCLEDLDSMIEQL